MKLESKSDIENQIICGSNCVCCVGCCIPKNKCVYWILLTIASPIIIVLFIIFAIIFLIIFIFEMISSVCFFFPSKMKSLSKKELQEYVTKHTRKYCCCFHLVEDYE